LKAKMVESDLVSLELIQEAHERIRNVVVRTPLYHAAALSNDLESKVLLKLESLQRTGSFKIRGAYNFVAQIPDEVRRHGVITYSSGNHAQAVALAAQLHGVRAVVVMPVDAPEIKREGALRLGAEVILEGTTSTERRIRAESIATNENLTVVPPYDAPGIIAGQGTTGLEIADDFDDFDVVLAPIGGGGLCSGCAAAIRRLRPEVKIVGVEPVGGASMKAALEAGGPVTLREVGSIADGLLPVRSGDQTFAHVNEFVDEVVLVEEDEIREAAKFLFLHERLVVEFSGAATVAALRSGKVESSARTVAAVVSGGNVDPGVIANL